MNLNNLAKRIERLEQLSRGLSREVTLCRSADEPLLPAERRTYLGGIQDTLAGLDAARVVLVEVCGRIERAEARRRTTRRGTGE